MSKTEVGPPSVVMEREMPYPPEKVWRAITEAHLIEEWLMKNDFKPVVGHRFNLRAEPQPHWNGVTDCEVLAVEPTRKLSYTWNSSGDEAANGLKTTVTWTLTRTSSGTLLRMEQWGFREDQQQNYQGANYGWQRFLATLETVLAKID
ncbi:MAG: SRPBCC family protein [Methylocella sp.]